jgi:hypothetical protein
MSIAVVYRPPAMTAEQYKASWSGSEGAPVPVPHGLLFHAGMGEGSDFFTVTVWKSREEYDTFAPMFKRTMSERGFEIRRTGRSVVDAFWTKMAEALAGMLGRQIEAAEHRKKPSSSTVRKGLFLVPRQATENNGPEL